MDDFPRPCKSQEGDQGGGGASQHERLPFANPVPGVITFDPYVRLNDDPRQRADDPDNG